MRMNEQIRPRIVSFFRNTNVITARNRLLIDIIMILKIHLILGGETDHVEKRGTLNKCANLIFQFEREIPSGEFSDCKAVGNEAFLATRSRT